MSRRHLILLCGQYGPLQSQQVKEVFKFLNKHLEQTAPDLTLWTVSTIAKSTSQRGFSFKLCFHNVSLSDICQDQWACFKGYCSLSWWNVNPFCEKTEKGLPCLTVWTNFYKCLIMFPHLTGKLLYVCPSMVKIYRKMSQNTRVKISECSFKFHFTKLLFLINETKS